MPFELSEKEMAALAELLRAASEPDPGRAAAILPSFTTRNSRRYSGAYHDQNTVPIRKPVDPPVILRGLKSAARQDARKGDRHGSR